MRRGTKSKFVGGPAALATFAAIAVTACVLNPRPDDPGENSLGTANPGPGAGGTVASGTGGGGPVFGIGQGGTNTGSPPVTNSDASAPRSPEAGDGTLADAAADSRVDAAADGRADAAADAARD